jgi:pimeloyl-ACP methyl ester carboxylesterase
MAQLRHSPAAPLRIWLRNTGQKIRPPCAQPYVAAVRHRQDAVLAAGGAGPHQYAPALAEAGAGGQPTIVIGGFVPDTQDALYLLRASLLKQGSLYTFSYPPRGFATDLFIAQLADCIEEVTARHGRPPVLIGISFGAGLLVELLRRTAAAGAALTLAGVVLISPVCGVSDLLEPGAAKATTLLGRVIKPYLDRTGPADDTIIARSRAVFLKMFEAGAQNHQALSLLLTRDETLRLRNAVLATINAITTTGVVERVRALRDFPALADPRCLCPAPALVLFAEKEGAVLREDAPTRQEFEHRLRVWFPQGVCSTVRNTPENPVQHASLIFHAQNFGQPLAAFYRQIKQTQHRAA